jgi:hypothetical protein
VYENQSVYAQPMYQGSNNFAADPAFYANNYMQYTAPATATGNYNMTTNTQQLSEAPQLAAPAQGVSNTIYLPQPGKDGQGFVSNQQPSGAANAFGYQPKSQALQGPGMPVAPSQQVQMPILDAASNPGFGGYDQNARATMYAPPMFNFRGYY